MDISELSRQTKGQLKRHPWETARAKAMQFLVKKHCVPVRHIADIGSGDAFVLNYLCEMRSAEAYAAVDTAYTDQVIEELKAKYNQTPLLYFKTQNEMELVAGKSDLILLLDVLEHCEDDRTVLASACNESTSTTDAKLLITVPAFASLFSQHDQLLGHFRRYNRRQVVEMCKSQNLLVIRSGYFFFTLLPFRIINCFLEKIGIRKTQKTIDNWNGSETISKLISTILWLDFRVCYTLSSLGINLPGLSCYCLCQKLPS